MKAHFKICKLVVTACSHQSFNLCRTGFKCLIISISQQWRPYGLKQWKELRIKRLCRRYSNGDAICFVSVWGFLSLPWACSRGQAHFENNHNCTSREGFPTCLTQTTCQTAALPLAMLRKCIKYSNSGWHLIDVPAVHSPFNFLPTFSTAFIKCHVSVSKEIGSGLMCSLGWMIFPLFQILRRQWRRETREEEREREFEIVLIHF